VLLIGQISSGKSSFYNTVESVFSNNVTMRASAGGREKSLTTKFRRYEVKAKDKENKPIRFRFCDTMGLSTESGLTPEQYGKLMDGHVRDGADLGDSKTYGENVGWWTKVPLCSTRLGQYFASEVKDYNKAPDKNDQMHCVAFIVADHTYIDESILAKFNAIRDEAEKRAVKVMVILTRIDDLISDITNVFLSRTIRDAVLDLSQKLGIAQNTIYPVQNYSIETEKDQVIDILALFALRQVLRCAETSIDDMLQRDKKKAPVHPGRQIKEAPAPQLTLCTAKYPYEGKEDDELDMTKGEEFTVLEQNVRGGWTKVQNSTGKTGNVPTTWLNF